MVKPRIKDLSNYHIVYHEGRRYPWTVEHRGTKKVYATFDEEQLAKELLAKGQRVFLTE